MTLYAAYATHLDPSRVAAIAPHSILRGTGWLPGWRLTFGGEDVGWDGAIATIVEDVDSQTFVALYDVTDLDEKTLDTWEGTDLLLWHKIRVRVATLNGSVVAWAYVLNAFEGGLPSAHYLGLVADAAEAGGAPADYVTGLRRTDCRSLGS